ncbi:MAG: metal-sulfur cluster assembly factor [Gemmatimonadota bacterium]
MDFVQLRSSGSGRFGRNATAEADRSRADAGYEPALERGMNFAAVLQDTLGRHPELALVVPTWDTPATDAREVAWRALHEVADPEFPISLPDLGLIYGVEVRGRTVEVTVSFTATACPCTDFIKWDIRERLLQEPEFDTVNVAVTWDPPWTTDRITLRGREQLRRAGVSVPAR